MMKLPPIESNISAIFGRSVKSRRGEQLLPKVLPRVSLENENYFTTIISMNGTILDKAENRGSASPSLETTSSRIRGKGRTSYVV